MSDNEQVRKEMEAFLGAIQSYPARFAANPGLTFEEHWAIERLAALPDMPLPAESVLKTFAAQA